MNSYLEGYSSFYKNNVEELKIHRCMFNIPSEKIARPNLLISIP